MLTVTSSIMTSSFKKVNCKSRKTDSAPKIDPKESAPKSKEDELDELLNLGSKKQNSMASTMSIKRSDPKVYDFSEPINNLHEGKASSGKDFRSPTKKGLEYQSFKALFYLYQPLFHPNIISH